MQWRSAAGGAGLLGLALVVVSVLVGSGSALVVVADPRPGDLRVSPEADGLPADYVAPPPARQMFDLGYGPEPEQRLDLHLPAEGRAPVVLYLHSGGWVGGDRGNVPEMVLRFVEQGYAVASVGYRLAPDHVFPAAVEDVNRAIRWLKVVADGDGLVDGDRIVLYGTSAGGHLAALAAAAPRSFAPTESSGTEEPVDTSVAGVVSVVGPTDLVALYSTPHPWAEPLVEALLGCSPCDEARLREASPVEYVHPGLPPAYWVYGENDCLVAPDLQGLPIASAWAESAGPFSSFYDRADGCGHNVDASLLNQRALEAFVDRVVGGTRLS